MDSDQGLQQACATMTAVRGPLVEFGLHADNLLTYSMEQSPS